LKHGLLDLILYIVIALFFIGSAVTLQFLSVRPVWFMFFSVTLFLGICVAKMYWHRRKSLRLSLLLLALLGIHVAGFVALLRSLERFPNILFLFVVPIEAMLVAAIVKVCLGIMPERIRFS